MTAVKILEANNDLALRKVLLVENARRLRTIGVIGSLVNVFIIVHTGVDGLVSPVNLIRIAWIIAALVYAVLASLGIQGPEPQPWLRPIFLGAATLSLVFSALVTAATSSSAGYTFVLIVNILLTATVLTMHPQETALIYTPCFITLALGLASGRPSALQNAGNLINIVAVTLFALSNAWFQWQAALRAHRFEEVIKAQNHLLHQLSELDGLTGIANRRKLDQCLEGLSSLAKRQAFGIAVLMIDIDDFKGFNDSHGHLAGDEVLKAVATRIASSVQRPQDCCGRYGGEEFMVVLAGVDAEGAGIVAERIRSSVEALRLGDLPLVTVSIGISCVGSEHSPSTHEMVAMADEALFLAKARGKNCLAWPQ